MERGAYMFAAVIITDMLIVGILKTSGIQDVINNNPTLRQTIVDNLGGTTIFMAFCGMDIIENWCRNR